MTGVAGDRQPAAEPIPDAYVVERVRDALTADERVGELGLGVELVGDTIVVRGAVSTPSRKAGVVPVVRQALTDLGVAHQVEDETEVPPATRAEAEEVLG